MLVYEESSVDFISLIEKIWMPILVAIVGYFGSRLNLTIKKIELYSQTKLRARELYFESYQKELDAVSETARVASKRHAENCLALHKIGDDKVRKTTTIKAFIKVHHEQIETHSADYDELYERIRNSPIMNSTRELEVKLVEKIFAIDTKNLPDEKLEEHFFALSKAYALIIKLEQNLVERKRDDLFSEYL